jgi:hypothetical protein
LPGPYGDPTETDVEPTLPEENSSLQIKAGRPVYEPPDSADDDDEGRTEGTCNDTWLTGTLERFEDAYDMLQQMDEDLANNRPNPRTLRADSRVMRDFSNDQLESRPPASAVRANVTASLLFDRWASMLEALADWASGNSDWITGNPNAEADFWRHRDAAVELEDRLTQDMTLVESGCN